MKETKTIIIVDDLDNPKNNKKAVELVKRFIERNKPDEVIDLGKPPYTK